MTRRPFTHTALTLAALALAVPAPAPAQPPTAFFENHCYSCHGPGSKKGGLDLTALKADLAGPEGFARWLKVHDRIEAPGTFVAMGHSTVIPLESTMTFSLKVISMFEPTGTVVAPLAGEVDVTVGALSSIVNAIALDFVVSTFPATSVAA
jgi:hypothetical protein